MERPVELATVGYQGATVESFLRALREAGVDLLVDVRAVAPPTSMPAASNTCTFATWVPPRPAAPPPGRGGTLKCGGSTAII